MTAIRAISAISAIAFCASTANAQAPLASERIAVTAAPAPVPIVIHQSAQASVPAMVAGGLLGGAIGLIAGGYSGALLTNNRAGPDDLSFLPGLIWGAAVGESVMLPVGVHLVNRQRGKLLPAVMASTVLGVGGLALALATQDSEPIPGIILAAVPLAQLATAITIERRAR